MLEMGAVTVLDRDAGAGLERGVQPLLRPGTGAMNAAHNAWVRVVHALPFEGGLIVMGVPLIGAVVVGESAGVLDIGVLLFFLPYLCLLRERFATRGVREGLARDYPRWPAQQAHLSLNQKRRAHLTGINPLATMGWVPVV